MKQRPMQASKSKSSAWTCLPVTTWRSPAPSTTSSEGRLRWLIQAYLATSSSLVASGDLRPQLQHAGTAGGGRTWHALRMIICEGHGSSRHRIRCRRFDKARDLGKPSGDGPPRGTPLSTCRRSTCGIEFCDFNTCAYASAVQGSRPQRVVGKLPGLASLSARCKSLPRHTVELGAQPTQSWSSRPASLRPDMCGTRPAGLAAQGAAEQRVQEGAQGCREQGFGGWTMQGCLVVGPAPAARAVGREISELLDQHVRKHPEAARAADKYGTKDFQIRGVEEWAAALRNHSNIESEDRWC